MWCCVQTGSLDLATPTLFQELEHAYVFLVSICTLLTSKGAICIEAVCHRVSCKVNSSVPIIYQSANFMVVYCGLVLCSVAWRKLYLWCGIFVGSAGLSTLPFDITYSIYDSTRLSP